MPQKFNTALKNWLPPVITRAIVKIRHTDKYGFFGNYKSWNEAKQFSKGYDNEAILQKVKSAALKVKNGEAAYERDSVVFSKVEYFWPTLAALLWTASKNDNRLSLIDFGGSLGTSYRQNKKFLSHLKSLRWNVVEQPLFAKCGKEFFEDEHLKFYDSLEHCAKTEHPDAVLISSVIQYVERPYDLLRQILNLGAKCLIFDRTPFLKDDTPERITVQRVPPKVYDASYPAWFLNEKKFLKMFEANYRLDFDTIPYNMTLDGEILRFRGFIFEKRSGI